MSYTIRPRSDSDTGDVIDAEARIVFDTEEPIDTPPIFNTIDAVSPTSVVGPLPATDQGGEFTVLWAGADDPDGSALADFIIYVSDNNGPFVPWLEDTTLTEGTYRGQIGHVYEFYSRARDNAGNGEGAPVTLEQPPAPTLSIADVSVAEGAGNAVLTITLSPTSTVTTTVDYATSGGDATPGQDYQATSSSETISAAATSTTIAVRIIDDTEDEPDETFVVTLSGPTAGAEVSSSDGAATVTIVDDDAAAVVLTLSIADVSVAEGAGNAVLTITLSPASTASITVDYATSGGDATPGQDYQATSSSATIPAAATSTTIAVRIIDDTEDEPDETFVVTLSGPTGGAQVSSSDGAATVTIVDDDVAPVVHTLSIADVSVAEGAGDAVLTITLDPPFTSTAVTVAYTTADNSATAGQDYRFASSTASIPAESTSTTITVRIINDTADEPNEIFTVTLSNPTGGAVISPTAGSANVTVLDDDIAGTITLAVPLATGFNLIGIPVQIGTNFRASDLAQQIADQGGEVSAILGWSAGSQVFDPWAAANPEVNDFVLQVGQGYFVRVVTPPPSGFWSASGLPVTASVPLDFETGFNLVAFPFTTQAHTAQTLAATIDGAGDNPSAILGWNAGSQVFDPWAAANPGVNPFDIDALAGYLVRMTAPVAGLSP